VGGGSMCQIGAFDASLACLLPRPDSPPHPHTHTTTTAADHRRKKSVSDNAPTMPRTALAGERGRNLERMKGELEGLGLDADAAVSVGTAVHACLVADAVSGRSCMPCGACHTGPLLHASGRLDEKC
jgi:hypothetical protein